MRREDDDDVWGNNPNRHSSDILDMKTTKTISVLCMLHAINALAQSNVFPSSGNVGIGVSNPEAILHVSKSTSGGSGGALFLDNQAGSAVGNSTEIAFSNDIGGAYAGVSGSRIKSITQNAVTGGSGPNFCYMEWCGGN